MGVQESCLCFRNDVFVDSITDLIVAFRHTICLKNLSCDLFTNGTRFIPVIRREPSDFFDTSTSESNNAEFLYVIDNYTWHWEKLDQKNRRENVNYACPVFLPRQSERRIESNCRTRFFVAGGQIVEILNRYKKIFSINIINK